MKPGLLIGKKLRCAHWNETRIIVSIGYDNERSDYFLWIRDGDGDDGYYLLSDLLRVEGMMVEI